MIDKHIYTILQAREIRKEIKNTIQQLKQENKQVKYITVTRKIRKEKYENDTAEIILTFYRDFFFTYAKSKFIANLDYVADLTEVVKNVIVHMFNSELKKKFSDRYSVKVKELKDYEEYYYTLAIYDNERKKEIAISLVPFCVTSFCDFDNEDVIIETYFLKHELKLVSEDINENELLAIQLALSNSF